MADRVEVLIELVDPVEDDARLWARVRRLRGDLEQLQGVDRVDLISQTDRLPGAKGEGLSRLGQVLAWVDPQKLIGVVRGLATHWVQGSTIKISLKDGDQETLIEVRNREDLRAAEETILRLRG